MIKQFLLKSLEKSKHLQQFQNLIKQEFTSFLTQCKSTDDRNSVNNSSSYGAMAATLSITQSSTLLIDFQDILSFKPDLADAIIRHFNHVYPVICEALRDYLQPLSDTQQTHSESVYHQVGFQNLQQQCLFTDLKASNVSTLIQIECQVLIVHSPMIELHTGCYKCEQCGSLSYIENYYTINQPSSCSKSSCLNTNHFSLNLYNSSFRSMQLFNIQEASTSSSNRCAPRQMLGVLRYDNVNSLKTGDIVVLVGSVSVRPHTSLKNNSTIFVSPINDVMSDHCYKLRLNVNSVMVKCASTPNITTYTEPNRDIEEDSIHIRLKFLKRSDGSEYSTEDIETVKKMRSDPELLSNISESVFSSIYGYSHIKEALILQVVGGQKKTKPDGACTRGNIHILILGNPSTAKSQFLKILIDSKLTKTIYTNGKASTRAGLMGTVIPDTSGNYHLEPGAIALADGGLLCIDEIDKMDKNDLNGLHEVMEQQTVSICKAGVVSTQLARTSILAAENPKSGLFDESKSISSNLPFHGSIISRFDLCFATKEQVSRKIDRDIAKLICDVHMMSSSLPKPKYSLPDVRLYISVAQQFSPKVGLDIEQNLIETFVRFRWCSRFDRTKVTVRMHHSVVRISEAIAKLHLNDFVTKQNVDYAASLMRHMYSYNDVVLPSLIHRNDDLVYQPLVDSTLTMEEYSTGARKIISLLNRKPAGVGQNLGMSRSDIVSSILSECKNSSDPVMDRIQNSVDGIINRLIYTDRVLLEFEGSGKVLNTLEKRAMLKHNNCTTRLMINPLCEGDWLAHEASL